MEQVIGQCSCCGGDVVQHRGLWMGVTPPPKERCTRCGAVGVGMTPVIPMRRLPSVGKFESAVTGGMVIATFSGQPSFG